MKIESGRGVTPSSTTRRSDGAAGPAFAPATDSAVKTAAASAASATHSIDSILALQGENMPGERRARQARRGRAALDALEELERGLVLGAAPSGLRARLESLRRGGEETGEKGLDEVLLEIDTRLAVEIAKLEMSGRHA